MPSRASEQAPAAARRTNAVISRIPLRLRITTWVVAIFSVVQVTLSLIIILYQRDSIQGRDEQRLVEAAQDITGEIASAEPGQTATDIALESPQLRWFGRVAAIDTNDDDRINIAGPFAPETFDQLRQAVRSGQFGLAGQQSSGRADGFFFAAQPLGEGKRYILAVPMEEANAPLRTITMALVVLLPAGIVASGVSAWYVAGLAVRPIRQVQHFAEELSAENVGGSLQIADKSPELESLQEELGLAMRRISAGYDAQARFLANISHEIKTPIAVVRTEGEVLLAGTPSDEDWRGFAHNTVEEMDRLGRMVESFLLLTRIRQGKSTVQAQRHAANDVLMETVGHCHAMARQYSVRLEPILYQDEADLQVEGNLDLLTTALGNLVRNAIRFSPRDLAIKISCGVRGKRVIFRVRDYGPGVPPEVLEHLFEPFTQGNSERQLGRGTGLGLQIAHGIAELHDGEVRVRNLNQGCEFSLRLRIPDLNISQTS
ncbi:MAG: HAMP domain-containing histidine kinase [Phycisphaera sp.]|nr:MAG: HAMP domain-containing histidine kinase [Phycisphaera sp.]